MTKKGWLLSFATVVSILTGHQVFDDPDKSFYIGLMVYLLCVAAANFHPIITRWDKAACRVFALGCVNYCVDWIWGDPYKPGINEYAFMVLIVGWEIYQYRKDKKDEAEKKAGRYK